MGADRQIWVKQTMIKDSFPQWLKLQPGKDSQENKWVKIYLKQHVQERAHAYFGPLLKRVRVVSVQEIEDELESNLSAAEVENLSLLDVLVRGSLWQADAPGGWLAIEVSAVIDRHDVERAERQAAVLRKVGFQVVPTVAGQDMTEGGESLAAERAVFVVPNGRKQHRDAALAKALSV